MSSKYQVRSAVAVVEEQLRESGSKLFCRECSQDHSFVSVQLTAASAAVQQSASTGGMVWTQYDPAHPSEEGNRVNMIIIAVSHAVHGMGAV
jgi:hypothetical protein